jgi:hypothetical protein
MAGEPKVRARHMKSMIAAAGRLPDGGGAAARALVRPAFLAQIEESSGVDWLPIECNLVVTRALHEVLAPAAFHLFYRDHLLESFQGPLLKTMVDAAIRIFGIDPASWARWVPKGWALVFRDGGAWTVARVEPGHVAFRLEGLPDACIRDRVWLSSVASSLSAIVEIAKAQGGFELTDADPVSGRASFAMRWS